MENKEVLMAELNNNTFTEIIKIYDINYAPLKVKNNKDTLKSLNEWFKGRGIPSLRKDLEKLLNNLKVNYKEELLLKSFGLSLSDEYWIKDINSNVTWDNINFFDNDFEYHGYLEATYSNSITNKVSLASPNNTTDGMLSKAWFIENNKRKLMKGTYTSSNQEPINEYIASLICKRLCINHVDYKIDIYNNKIVSVCDNCIHSDEEIISAYDVFMSKKKGNNESDYRHYVNILKEMGLNDIEKNLSDMYLID